MYTISLNSHYLVLFKNPRNVGQFSILARQMYPSGFKFAEEAYRDATERPFGYLFVDLKPPQDEWYRLRTNIFPGEMQYVYVRKWSHSWVGERCMTEQESTSRSLQTVSTSGKLQRDNPSVANFTPQPGPHHSGAHRDMSIRILRPPRNSLSCRSKESLGRRLFWTKNSTDWTHFSIYFGRCT